MQVSKTKFECINPILCVRNLQASGEYYVNVMGMSFASARPPSKPPNIEGKNG
jgi:hypothetical protein